MSGDRPQQRPHLKSGVNFKTNVNKEITPAPIKRYGTTSFMYLFLSPLFSHNGYKSFNNFNFSDVNVPSYIYLLFMEVVVVVIVEKVTGIVIESKKEKNIFH